MAFRGGKSVHNISSKFLVDVLEISPVLLFCRVCCLVKSLNMFSSLQVQTRQLSTFSSSLSASLSNAAHIRRMILDLRLSYSFHLDLLNNRVIYAFQSFVHYY